MDKRNSLDSLVKSSLQLKTYSIEPSRDIFEEAWKNKDNAINEFSINKPIKRRAIVAACLTIVSLVAIISFSPNVKTLANEVYKSIRTIFTLEKVGDGYKVVQKSEDIKQEYWNIAGVNITEANKEEFEKKLGFKFYLPKKVGDDVTNGGSWMGMTVYGIKLKDQEVLRDKFFKAITDDTVFAQLNNYKKVRWASAEYGHTYGGMFSLDMSNDKENLGHKDDKIVKELEIENIKCKIVEVVRGKYPIIHEGSWSEDDITQQPEIAKVTYVRWNYNGVNYSVTTYGKFEYDKVMDFVQGYIKGLKQQNIK